MNALIIDTTDATFISEVLQSDIWTLVLFWDKSCNLSKELVPVFNALASTYNQNDPNILDLSGPVKFIRAHIDENKRHYLDFKPGHLPAILLFKDGQLIRTTGDKEMSKTILLTFF
jgi:thioredoxin 1